MPDARSREFHARMEQPEPGLFRATYRADINPDDGSAKILSEGPHILPDTHIGTDEASVRSFVETLARGRGFDRVIWDTDTPRS